MLLLFLVISLRFKCAYHVSDYSIISSSLGIISPGCCSCFLSHVEFHFLSVYLFIFTLLYSVWWDNPFRAVSLFVSSRSLGGFMSPSVVLVFISQYGFLHPRSGVNSGLTPPPCQRGFPVPYRLLQVIHFGPALEGRVSVLLFRNTRLL